MSVELSKVDIEKLAEYIYRKSGIALTESHHEKLKTKFQSRCSVHGFKTFRQYFFALRYEDENGSEFQELINTLTVNETYFFRENHQFEALTEFILKELDEIRPKDRPLRILNAPCSTGEESYTVAIHLLEDDDTINKRDIEIVGIDIDSKVIEKANSAIFSQRSVHAIPKPLVAKYFKQRLSNYEVIDDLQGVIEFKVANVFDKNDMKKLGKFDVIFSRNMLIYFDDSSRKEVAMTFYDMLNPGGYVMLGHAEYMNRIVSVFKPKKYGKTMAYQK